MEIERLDHIVLTVADVAATCAFYERVLGMEITTFGAGRKALVFGSQKINLHPRDGEPEPRALFPTPGSGDLCFVTARPMAQVVAHLAACRVNVIEGPVERTGATGRLWSVYFRDPDGNLLELSNYL